MKKIKSKKVNKSTSIKEKVKTLSNKKKISNIVLIVLALGGICLASLILIFALYIIIASPDFDRDLLYKQESSVLYDINENEIARIGSENRVLITYNDLPQVLIDALLATEDSRFFQHNGLDGARFLMASIKQVLGNSSAGGASTLSMQVIKNTYTGKQAEGIAGIIRKFTDIYMAVFKLESVYTKEEIIEFYFNSQWLGNDGDLNYSGIYGVEQASQYYFGKSVGDLNLSEASLLVGMFQNPNLYNPYKNPEGCTNRRNTVLSLMVKHGYITEDEKKLAQEIDVRSLIKKKKTTTKNAYQAFIDYVINDVEETTGHNAVKTPMKIYTTLDPTIQDVLNKVENEEIYTFPNDDMQMGVAITSVKNGAILALSGGRDYAAKGLNRATGISRQPGSTAKILFDYGPYIEYLNGSTYTMLLDEPYTYSNGTKINNFDNSYKGLITMREALVQSRNIPALKTFQKVYAENPNYISDFVHSLGIDYGDNLYESASIGGFDGTNPLEMSAAYAAFARGGYYIKPYSFSKIIYLEDEKEYDNKYTKTRVMSEETAYLITDILVTAGERNVGGDLKISGSEIATKGGTTNLDSAAREELKLPSGVTPDHWNISYSPDYCIALWSGYDTTTKEHYLTNTLGGKVRRGIMSAVGKRIYKKDTKFKKPSGVVSVEVELETFPPQLASEYTPSNLVKTELFKKGTEPSEVSSRFDTLANPQNGSYTFDGSNIKISWNAINTPDAINETYLQEHFNKYYENDAAKYYQKRLNYNQSNIGTLGYQVYLKDANGNLTSLGFTKDTTFTYPATSSTTAYTFVVKSAYSIFKNNMSSGLTINAYAKMDSNVENIVDDSSNNTNINPSENLD